VVRHHTLGNYGEADLSPVRSWVLDRVGHHPTSWARAFANFRELRNGEVRRILFPRTPVNKDSSLLWDTWSFFWVASCWGRREMCTDE
jgi:hypothetical protein